MEYDVQQHKLINDNIDNFDFIYNNMELILQYLNFEKANYIVECLIKEERKFPKFWKKFLQFSMDAQRYCLVKPLIEKAPTLINKYPNCFKKVLFIKNSNNKNTIIDSNTIEVFIDKLLYYGYNSKLIFYFCNKLLDNYSKNDLSDTLIKYKNNENILKYLKHRSQDIIKSSQRKLSFITCFKDNLNNSIVDKYKPLLKLIEEYNKYKNNIYMPHFEGFTTIEGIDLIKNIFDKYYNHKVPIEFLDNGHTSIAFRIGKYVLKIGETRYRLSPPPEHFRIIKPLEFNVINNSKKEVIAVSEVQEYIPHKKTDITPEMIIQLFTDLQKDHIEITDPNCLSLKPDNFALLPDYRMANCKNCGTLPEHFKQNPLVLIDTDLVYDEQEENKFYSYIQGSTMSNVITEYNKVKVKRLKAKI